jgi:hypothetical protein
MLVGALSSVGALEGCSDDDARALDIDASGSSAPDAARRDASQVDAAGAGTGRGDASAGVGDERRWTRFVLENESGSDIWVSGGWTADGRLICGDAWVTTGPAHPALATAADGAAGERAQAEFGCLCRCGELESGETCNPSDCPVELICLPEITYGALASGESVEVMLAPFGDAGA